MMPIVYLLTLGRSKSNEICNYLHIYNNQFKINLAICKQDNTIVCVQSVVDIFNLSNEMFII